MNLLTELANVNTNYLERVLDLSTIKNISNFGTVYKKYITGALTDTVYGDDLTEILPLVVSLVLDEDLPSLYIGEFVGILASKTPHRIMAQYRIDEVPLTRCKRQYANNSNINNIIDNINENSSNISNLLEQLPPKEICLYQQYNICCYTEDYIKKYSIQNKLGYKDLANINDEVAAIYNLVFDPSTPKTSDDRLGEYYLRINDANPDVFLDPSNELFIISSLMNYSFNENLLEFFDSLSYSSLKEEISDISSWEDFSKKYRLFFKLLRENTLSY